MVPFMMLTPMPVVSFHADANGVTWPKSHLAPHFSCHKLWNAVMSLMMLLASCDTDASANVIK